MAQMNLIPSGFWGRQSSLPELGFSWGPADGEGFRCWDQFWMLSRLKASWDTAHPEAGGRWAPQGKAIEDSFPIDQISKTRIVGRLREKAGPCPDHISLTPDVRRPPRSHVHRKAPCRPMGEQCQGQGMSYLHAFLVKSILDKRCMHIHGRSRRYTKCGLWTRKLKMIGQRKPRRNNP